MDRLLQILKSRTVLTGIAIVLVNGVPALQLPEAYQPLVNGILGLLAIYFRITPRQKF